MIEKLKGLTGDLIYNPLFFGCVVLWYGFLFWVFK